MNKTLGNTDADGAKKNVKDIVFWGVGDTFKLICKASSKEEGWMKSTKAMEIEDVGCVVQVSTQQGDNVAESIVFVPGVRIEECTDRPVGYGNEEHDADAKIISRKLVRM